MSSPVSATSRRPPPSAPTGRPARAACRPPPLPARPPAAPRPSLQRARRHCRRSRARLRLRPRQALPRRRSRRRRYWLCERSKEGPAPHTHARAKVARHQTLSPVVAAKAATKQPPRAAHSQSCGGGGCGRWQRCDTLPHLAVLRGPAANQHCCGPNTSRSHRTAFHGAAACITFHSFSSPTLQRRRPPPGVGHGADACCGGWRPLLRRRDGPRDRLPPLLLNHCRPRCLG
jgi:hypothetical protein